MIVVDVPEETMQIAMIVTIVSELLEEKSLRTTEGETFESVPKEFYLYWIE